MGTDTKIQRILRRKWYIYRDETQSGPFEIEEIKRKIENGTLNWVDFIYSSGYVMSWTRICELDAFKSWMPKYPLQAPVVVREKKSESKPPSPPVVIDLDSKKNQAPLRRNWVWYIQFAGGEFGPYGFHEVQDLYMAGKLTGPIFLWRKGLESWVPIEETTEFRELTEMRKNRPRAGMTGNNEKRNEKRFPLVATLFFKGSDSDTLGICSNISSKGMKILSDKLPEKTGIVLQFFLNPHASSGLMPMMMTGKVVNISEDQRSFALEFQEISKSTQAALERYLLTQKTRGFGTGETGSGSNSRPGSKSGNPKPRSGEDGSAA